MYSMQPIHEAHAAYTWKKLLTDCMLCQAQCYGGHIWQERQMQMWNGWNGCLFPRITSLICIVARFIRVLDQCNTVGAVKTYSGCRRRAVVDIFTCLCSKNARFQIMSAYHEFSPGTSRLTTDLGRQGWMQPRRLLAVKCWAIVIVKQNCDKYDM